MPWDSERYLPTPESIEKQKEEMRQKKLQKMKLTQSKPSKRGYMHGIISVPSDYRPVVGANYQ
jgi:hypothetical protein